MSLFFFFKQKTAYEIYQCDWSSDVCSSDLGELHLEVIIDRLRREFKVAVVVGKPRVAYREAILSSAQSQYRYIKQTGGHGQYGDVVLEISPTDSRTGFEFKNRDRKSVV